MKKSEDFQYQEVGEKDQHLVNYDYDLLQSVFRYIHPNKTIKIPIGSSSRIANLNPLSFKSHWGKATVHFYLFLGYAFDKTTTNFIQLEIVYVNGGNSSVISYISGTPSEGGIPLFLMGSTKLNGTGHGHFEARWKASKNGAYVKTPVNICFLARIANMHVTSPPVQLLGTSKVRFAPLSIPTTASPLTSLGINLTPLPKGGIAEYILQLGYFSAKYQQKGTVQLSTSATTFRGAAFWPSSIYLYQGYGTKNPTSPVIPTWQWDTSNSQNDASVLNNSPLAFLATIQDLSVNTYPDPVVFTSQSATHPGQTIPTSWQQIPSLDDIVIPNNVKQNAGYAHFNLIVGNIKPQPQSSVSNVLLRVLMIDPNHNQTIILTQCHCGSTGPLLLAGLAIITKYKTSHIPIILRAEWMCVPNTVELEDNQQISFTALFRG